ncbi:uncharacterized protein LOC128552313 [Mercenaria mercenaria]|uniref:uncharacterized protein LOC128552313 n=1 Tax=Mercenaria mercenaria TaxID=6596 RepID=UPI00234E543C|nr:uncharacterized protein LOC128552313 [Mercenaria mercenaria]
MKPKKCQLFKKEVEFLGHIINENGVGTDPTKIECIKQWPTPHNVTEIRSFLGLCGYYRKFILGYPQIARPLVRLTEKNTRFSWDTDCEESFKTLKNKLITAPILAHPDFSLPFILDTDACDYSIGAVLSQKIEKES